MRRVVEMEVVTETALDMVGLLKFLIKIKLKGGSTSGPESLTNGNEQLPVSASYTSDTLFIDVEDYSGGIEVEVVNTLTNQTVLQTFDLITGGNGTVEVDISALTHGIYRVDIYLPSSSGSYEGYFEIEWLFVHGFIGEFPDETADFYGIYLKEVKYI